MEDGDAGMVVLGGKGKSFDHQGKGEINECRARRSGTGALEEDYN
jgi:hypothetical protein